MGGLRRFAVISASAFFFSLGLLTSALRAVVTSNPLHYTMTDLGSLGGTAASPSAINSVGTVVGVGFLPGNSTHHAFRSTGVINPSTDDLGLPATLASNANSVAVDINSNGQVVAMAIPKDPVFDGIPPWRTYLVSPNGSMSTATDIGTLGGDYALAERINNNGQIVGWSGLSGSNWHAFLYTPGSGMLDLGAPNSSYSHAYDVNNSGQIVGWVDASNGSKAFRTLPNSPIRVQDYLGTLGGPYVGAMAINDAGQVTGHSDLAGNSNSHVFRTAPNAPINPATDDLGGLPGSLWSDPFEINNQGDVVGWSYISSISKTRAFISYGDSNAMYDLNDLIDNRGAWVFDLAQDINDQGLIVARAHLNGIGFDHAFLLTPVPEPTFAMIILPALLAIGRRARDASRE